MGGEGFKPELDLLRQGKFTAVNVISSSWTGWSSIDTMNSVFLKKPPVDSGIGWTIADKDHNVPASGEIIPSVDYKSAYKKAWGVS
jgi:ribose transport system substrate-binding protein